MKRSISILALALLTLVWATACPSQPPAEVRADGAATAEAPADESPSEPAAEEPTAELIPVPGAQPAIARPPQRAAT